jgi:hypothetical protein
MSPNIQRVPRKHGRAHGATDAEIETAHRCLKDTPAPALQQATNPSAQ